MHFSFSFTVVTTIVIVSLATLPLQIATIVIGEFFYRFLQFIVFALKKVQETCTLIDSCLAGEKRRHISRSRGGVPHRKNRGAVRTF